MDKNIKQENKSFIDVKKELVIGGDDLNLYVDAYIDGEKILSKKSDSLLIGFLHCLFLQMNGFNDDSMPNTNLASDLNSTSSNVNTPVNITSIASGINAWCVCTLSPEVVPNPSYGKVSIQGIQGTSPFQDGFYNYIKGSSSSITVSGTLYGTGYTASSASARMTTTYLGSYTVSPSVETFSSPHLVIGTGTTPVSLLDPSLEKEIQSAATTGRLTYGTTAVSDESTDSISSQITFTRTFTNNTSSGVVVNEVGLYADYGYHGSSYTQLQILLARDIISGGIEVSTGKALTLNYRIVSTLTTGTNPGGFTQIFMQLLRRHFKSTARNAKDIFNTDSTSSYASVSTFKVIEAGANTRAITFNEACDVPAWRQGIALGTSAVAVSEDDFYLNSIIEHGTSTGQLYHYGTVIDNWVASSGVCSFDIIRVFENASGADIDNINEIGLIVGGSNSTGDVANFEHPKQNYMIARNVLSSPVTATNGQMLKVTYTLKVIL